MSLSLDKTFAVPAAALKVHAERLQLLAQNIANADTPHYKARDIDFRAVLRHAGGADGKLLTTDPRHLQPTGGVENPTVKYRVPASPSLDGNTVEIYREQAAFAESVVYYRAALSFFSSRVQGLISALQGGK